MHKRTKDLSGKAFGRLLVVRYAGQDKRGRAEWFCRCECGTEKVVSANAILTGKTRSCGCLNRDVCGNSFRTHGMTDTPEYRSWRNMLNRCLNPKVVAYVNYGGRGIKVCESWMSFENFLNDMGPLPSPRHQIDRIDNDGDYEPSNCRWVTASQNSRNRRSTTLIEFRGQTKCVREWAQIVGIGEATIRRRLGLGWDSHRALTQKIRTSEAEEVFG